MLLGPILPILISRWSLTDERAGLFFTTQFCGQLAGCLSTGVLIPLRGRGYRLTFAIGFALIALGVAALGLGDAHAGLAGTALYGYGLGLALTGGNLWVAEIFPQRRATAVSILNVTWTIGAIACGPLVMLAEDLHMLAKFLVGVALFHAICALLIGVWDIEPLERGTDELDAGGAAPRTRLIGAAAFALGGLFFLYVGTESAVGGWVAAYANRVESISAMMAALTPAFFWCGLAAGRALAPVALRSLAARKRERKFCWASALVSRRWRAVRCFLRRRIERLHCARCLRAWVSRACTRYWWVGWFESMARRRGDSEALYLRPVAWAGPRFRGL